MKLLGIFFWLFTLFALVLLYGRSERTRFAEYEGLCLLIRHIEEQLSSFSRPLPEIYASFENTALARCGFLDHLREGGLSHALATPALSLDKDALLPFRAFASDLGTRRLTEELAACRELRSRLSLSLEERRSDLPRRRKLTSTLILSSGMMLLLFLL